MLLFRVVLRLFTLGGRKEEITFSPRIWFENGLQQSVSRPNFNHLNFINYLCARVTYEGGKHRNFSDPWGICRPRHGHWTYRKFALYIIPWNSEWKKKCLAWKNKKRMYLAISHGVEFMRINRDIRDRSFVFMFCMGKTFVSHKKVPGLTWRRT